MPELLRGRRMAVVEGNNAHGLVVIVVRAADEGAKICAGVVAAGVLPVNELHLAVMDKEVGGIGVAVAEHLGALVAFGKVVHFAHPVKELQKVGKAGPAALLYLADKVKAPLPDVELIVSRHLCIVQGAYQPQGLPDVVFVVVVQGPAVFDVAAYLPAFMLVHGHERLVQPQPFGNLHGMVFVASVDVFVRANAGMAVNVLLSLEGEAQRGVGQAFLERLYVADVFLFAGKIGTDVFQDGRVAVVNVVGIKKPEVVQGVEFLEYAGIVLSDVHGKRVRVPCIDIFPELMLGSLKGVFPFKEGYELFGKFP